MSTRVQRVLIAAAGVLVLALAGIVAYTLESSRSAPADRRTERAPIEAVEVARLESSPPQYVVKVRAGLPSGCAQGEGHQLSRTGELIEVTVLNSQPAGNQVCTMIYGMYDLSINLGTDFRRGVTYTVRVNDKTATFVAQ